MVVADMLKFELLLIIILKLWSLLDCGYTFLFSELVKKYTYHYISGLSFK